MTYWKSGEIITAAKMEPWIARYERTSGSQSVAASTDTQVQFPTAVTTSTYITPGGTSNSYFTIASGSGVWEVTAGQRVSNAHASWEMSLAVGSTTWSVANVKSSGGSSSLNVHAGAVVVDATASSPIVCCGTWQTGGAYTITFFGGATHIEFVRIA